jgi:lipopolysaccharide exporter
LVESGGLFRRVVKGGAWVFGFSVAQEILAMARLVILARLLSPKDFGLAGIAVLILGALDTFSYTGFDSALIQKKEDTRAYLDSAWTLGAIRGVVVFAILIVIAPYGAAFFKTPEATSLIRVVGLSLLARSLTSIGSVYFRKELEFDKQFVWQFAGRLTDFIVAIIAAFALRNAWALALAFTAGETAKAIASYVLHPYRPRLRLEWAKIRELFGFGKWLLGLGIIAFLLTQGDNALIGRVVGATALGFYALARRISNVPSTEIAHVISVVTFPAYSKIQDNLAKLRGAYLMVVQLTALAAVPVSGAILVLAPDIITIFFGAKWLPAAVAVRVLAVWGGFGAIAATAEPALVAVGRPRKLAKYQFVQAVILAALIYPLTLRWGIAGAAGAVALASVVPYCLALRKAASVTTCGAACLLRATLPAVGAAGVAAMAVAAGRHWMILKTASPSGFGLAVAAFAALYVGLVYLYDRRSGWGIGALLKDMLSALRGTSPPAGA